MKLAVLLFLMGVGLLLVSTVESVGKHTRSGLIKPCSLKQPSRDNCLKGSINVFIKNLSSEPLVIEELGPVAVKILGCDFVSNFKNVNAEGVSKLTLTKLVTEITSKDVELQMDFTIPTITVVAEADTQGSVFGVDVNTRGRYSAEYKEVKAHVVISSGFKTRERVKYMDPKNVTIDYSVGSANMEITNTGRFVIFDTIDSELMNSNWKKLVDATKTVMIKKFEPMLMKFAKKLFKWIPYHKWIKN